MSRASSSGRRLAWIAAGVAVLTALVIVVQVLGAPRQSGVRAIARGKASLVAQAAKLYEQQHGSTPRVADLWAGGMIDPIVAEEFSPVGPAVGAPLAAEGGISPVVVQVRPCRAVKKGEAWGGPGEVTEVARQACRYVLMSDWTVVEMEEAEYQRDWAGKVTLLPWK